MWTVYLSAWRGTRTDPPGHPIQKLIVSVADGTLALDVAIDPAVHDRRWAILAVLCTSLMIVIIGNTALNVAIPTLARELDASTTDLQWMVDSYALVFAGLLFTAGSLGDRFGRKGALQAGLLLFLAGTVLASTADTSTMVIAARALMGLAAAFVMPSTLSILTNVFPAHERARAIAVWAGISGGGAALGPVASGFLLEHFFWGSVFLVNVPMIVLALLAKQLFGWDGTASVLMVTAALIAGGDIARRAWAALRVRHIGIELLVTIAAVGAIAIGEVWEAAAVTFHHDRDGRIRTGAAVPVGIAQRQQRQELVAHPEHAALTLDGAHIAGAGLQCLAHMGKRQHQGLVAHRHGHAVEDRERERPGAERVREAQALGNALRRARFQRV